MRAPTTRRRFLLSSARASLGAAAAGAVPGLLQAQDAAPEPRPRREVVRGALAQRFPDLRHHFLFEYYPWYGGPPRHRHWDQWDRVPPLDLASNFVPRLGAYDSRSRAVVEQHARWIAGCGVGSVALSWWGPGSYEDQATHLVMDVMRDHGIKVAFHLEPYRPDRGAHFAEDVLYLLREYGERRRWDAFLLLRDADGRQGPVFKGFRMIVPPTARDCHGVEHTVSDFTADATWRQQTDRLRSVLRADFDHVRVLADSLDFPRTARSGFDGIAIYDHFIPPDIYPRIARVASEAGMLFSLNANPGFHTIEPREVDPGSCYQPTPFAPPTPGIDLARADHVELAAQRSMDRIRESFAATLTVQSDPALDNFRRGFFLVYVNSFNEWHEGHAFEPMKDRAGLTAAELALGYDNPQRGDYRLSTLAELLRTIL